MEGIRVEISLVALFIALVALVVTALGFTVEWKSLLQTQKIQKFLQGEAVEASKTRSYLEHMAETQPSLTEEFDGYLLEEGAEGHTRLEVMTAMMGKALYHSTKGASTQEASVDSRAFNKYDEQIQEAVKQQMPVGYKMLFKVAEMLGIDLNEVMEAGELTQFVDAAKKNRLDLLMGVNNPSSGGQM